MNTCMYACVFECTNVLYVWIHVCIIQMAFQILIFVCMYVRMYKYSIYCMQIEKHFISNAIIILYFNTWISTKTHLNTCPSPSRSCRETRSERVATENLGEPIIPRIWSSPSVIAITFFNPLVPTKFTCKVSCPEKKLKFHQTYDKWTLVIVRLPRMMLQCRRRAPTSLRTPPVYHHYYYYYHH